MLGEYLSSVSEALIGEENNKCSCTFFFLAAFVLTWLITEKHKADIKSFRAEMNFIFRQAMDFSTILVGGHAL